MSKIDDDAISAAVRGLPHMAEPDGWDRTPILDGWRWQWSANGELIVVGHIYGHGVVGDGKSWVSDVVTGLDAGGRFVEDLEKAVYRLGWPYHGQDSRESFWPPVLHVAAYSRLPEAVDGVVRFTGAATLPADMLVYLDAARLLKASPKDRRDDAERLATALFRQARSAIAAAWMLIATDLRDNISRATTATSIEWAVKDVEKARERECTTAETRAANGWTMLAEMGDNDVEQLIALAGLDRTDQIAAAHAVAQIVETLPKKSKSLVASILGLDSDDDPLIVHDNEHADGKATVVVLREVGSATTEWGKAAKRAMLPIVGKPIPLAPVPDLDAVGTALRAEFPYAAEQIGVVLSDLVGAKYCRLRPTLFVGEPGGGKSRLARRLAETLGLHSTRYDGAAAADNSFGGTERRWHSGEASVPVRAMVGAQAATAVVLIDEVDKAGTGGLNGIFAHALLPFLEPETSKRSADPYVQAPVDCSHITYLATANDETKLPAVLRDRFRIIRIPPPRLVDVPAISNSIVADLARESGSDPRWYPPLDQDEIGMAQELWRRSGAQSLRRLREIVSRILVHRADMPRH